MNELGSHWEREDLGDGRFRHVQHMKPVAFIQNGAWRRITNRLGASGDSALTVGSNELTQFRLRDRLSGNAPVVHFGAGKSMVRLTPLDTANVLGRAYGENGWEYANAWNGADLRLVNGGHILRKEIALRAGHPSAFSFRIDENIGLDADTLSTSDFRIVNPVLEGPDEKTIGLSWEKATQGGKLILTARLPAGNYAGWTLDPTLVLQPGPADGKDALIHSGDTTFNYGTGSSVYRSFDTRGLLAFDCSSIPASATCVSALFEGTQALSDNRYSLSAIGIYSISSANADWVEGTRNGALALAGECCWAAKAADGAGGIQVAWAGSAGLGTSGVDYEAALLGSYEQEMHDPVGTIRSTYLTPTRVQGWFGPSNTNYGLLFRFIVSLMSHGIASSNHATPAWRPKLTLEITLPAGLRIFAVPFAAPFGGPFM